MPASPPSYVSAAATCTVPAYGATTICGLAVTSITNSSSCAVYVVSFSLGRQSCAQCPFLLHLWHWSHPTLPDPGRDEPLELRSFPPFPRPRPRPRLAPRPPPPLLLDPLPSDPSYSFHFSSHASSDRYSLPAWLTDTGDTSNSSTAACSHPVTLASMRLSTSNSVCIATTIWLYL
jgi:hypothetical protein